jgi:uncharacterized protein involved in exopolysaccharide biosynthesis
MPLIREGRAPALILCVVEATAYVTFATPRFVATAQVALEPRQPSTPTDSAEQATAPTLDSAQADTQTQILQSERDLRYVFDTLQLASDPEFADMLGTVLNEAARRK